MGAIGYSLPVAGDGDVPALRAEVWQEALRFAGAYTTGPGYEEVHSYLDHNDACDDRELPLEALTSQERHLYDQSRRPPADRDAYTHVAAVTPAVAVTARSAGERGEAGPHLGDEQLRLLARPGAARSARGQARSNRCPVGE